MTSSPHLLIHGVHTAPFGSGPSAYPSSKSSHSTSPLPTVPPQAASADCLAPLSHVPPTLCAYIRKQVG